jgi:hypothetical protein
LLGVLGDEIQRRFEHDFFHIALAVTSGMRFVHELGEEWAGAGHRKVTSITEHL